MWRDKMRRARSPAEIPHGREGGPAGSFSAFFFEFAFEDRPIRAQLGQSVAAALLANGVRTLRIDEAGNPKGILCGIGYCFECRCVIDDEPDRRACMVEAKPRMRVRRQVGLA
jgi:ferredoxin